LFFAGVTGVVELKLSGLLSVWVGVSKAVYCGGSHVGTPDPSLASLEETRGLYDSCLQSHCSSQEPAGDTPVPVQAASMIFFTQGAGRL